MSKIGSLAAVLFILSAAAAADAFSFRFLSAEDKPVAHEESPSPTPGPSPVHMQLSPPPPALVPPPPALVPPPPALVPPPPALVPPPPALVPPPPALVPPPSALVPPPPPVDSGGPALVPPPPPADEAAPGGEKAGCGEAAERCLTTELIEATERCRTTELVACVRHSAGSFLLVHNRGEDALTVNITTLIDIDPTLHLAKHGCKKISVSTNTTDVIDVVLNAGKGNCTLHIRPSISDWMYSQQFHAYASRLTPIHGAYILFASMVITGGTWACCKFGRKSRRAGSGVPYQQLEMGTQVQTSSSVADTNTADGWEDNWDEGWDEEQAVVRPDESHPAVNVSSNGLTSRLPNKDGWDNDWDD